MPESIGVAFVGCTHPHIFPRRELLLAEPGVQLVGCYDPDPTLAGALAAQYGLPAFPSPEALLDRSDVKLVIVEGWDTDNSRYARLALERRQAVLLEKPGAPDLQTMRALMDDVRAAQVPFQMGYQLRFSPVLAPVQHILASDLLGPITLARFHAAAPVGGAAERWQSVPGNLGGLVYTDGCHMIDLMIHLLGMPRRVRGMLLSLPAGPPVLAHGFKQDTLAGLGETLAIPLGGLMYEDAGAALLDYGDKLATFDITGWEAHPWVEAWRIELYGTDATLYIGLQPPQYKLYVRNPKQGYTAGWHAWEGFSVGGVGASLVVDDNYRGEMAHMLRRVRDWDTDNARSVDDALGVITVLDAIFRSDREGGTVALDERYAPS